MTDPVKVAKIVRRFDALPTAPHRKPVLARRFLVRAGRLLRMRLVPVARP